MREKTNIVVLSTSNTLRVTRNVLLAESPTSNTCGVLVREGFSFSALDEVHVATLLFFLPWWRTQHQQFT